VEKIIAISTDKAVSPVSLYGGSKFCAEKLFLAANISQNCTRFSVVRYGNMIGSRGSVIPLFKEKKHEGVLPITDTRMTRFWITLEESVEFTLRCIEMMSGGEIFVPKIPSMNILELAQAICPKCQHKIIGPRPGEKLHEELISEDEARFTWEWEDFFVIQPEFIPSAKKWQNGKKVPDRFTYRSDTNRNWLRREELRKLIKNF
jgi:UDP-N-acetylglucosamine 4,6-dehydratase